MIAATPYLSQFPAKTADSGEAAAAGQITGPYGG
jgi:hypothetical protein